MYRRAIAGDELNPEPSARWRHFVDWAKRRPWLLRMIEPMSRGRGRWRFIDRFTCRAERCALPDLSGWNEAPLAACWIGHATVLLKLGPLTVLTDPVFASRVGLGGGCLTIGPGRLVRPALSIAQLPRIDLVLLSHAHFDHLDVPSLWTLARRFRGATLISATGLHDLTRDLPFRIKLELPIGVEHAITTATGDVRVTAIPVQHWAARILRDTHRGVCAFLLEHAGRRVLFGGDSAFHHKWKPLSETGGVDLGIVGIGGYHPWIEGHANPEQAWEMIRHHAGARHILPMHFGTFKLSVEPVREPIARFLGAAAEERDRVVIRAIGEVWKEKPDGEC